MSILGEVMIDAQMENKARKGVQVGAKDRDHR